MARDLTELFPLDPRKLAKLWHCKPGDPRVLAALEALICEFETVMAELEPHNSAEAIRDVRAKYAECIRALIAGGYLRPDYKPFN